MKLFPAVCRAAGLPEPVPELRFAAPRRWRFDWAWPDLKLALEVQGGLFVNGRHSRGADLLQEHEKLNAAAVAGWRILVLHTGHAPNGGAGADCAGVDARAGADEMSQETRPKIVSQQLIDQRAIGYAEGQASVDRARLAQIAHGMKALLADAKTRLVIGDPILMALDEWASAIEAAIGAPHAD